MKAGRKSGVPKEVRCFKGVLNLEVRRPKSDSVPTIKLY